MTLPVDEWGDFKKFEVEGMGVVMSLEQLFQVTGTEFVQSRAGFSVGDRVRLNAEGIAVHALSSLEEVKAQVEGVLITEIMNTEVLPRVYPVGLAPPLDYMFSTDQIEKVL